MLEAGYVLHSIKLNSITAPADIHFKSGFRKAAKTCELGECLLPEGWTVLY